MTARTAAAGDLHTPRILSPVALGDTEVWVSGVTPGATVSIRRGETVIGQRTAPDPVLAIAVQAVTGPVHPVAQLENQTTMGAVVRPVRQPAAATEFPGATHHEIRLGPFAVPEHRTPEGVDGGFDVDLRAHLYTPANAQGKSVDDGRVWPLVVIAHGYWLFPDEDLSSLLGYAWLAEHLARVGARVCSIDLSTVNLETSSQRWQQWSRGEVILAVIDRLLADRTVTGHLDRGRIALVGHSMSGEGVVMAQVLNRRRGRPLGIRAVVSLAPTNYRADQRVTHAAYLQLHGSLDYLLASPQSVTGTTDPRFSAFRLYDRAWRHRTLAFIEGARHEGWNSVWLASPNSLERAPDPDLPILSEAVQHRIGRDLVSACLLDALMDQEVYRGYLSGPARPSGLATTGVQIQYQSPAIEVIEDCGDPDGQLGSPPEDPADKSVNRRGEAVNAVGPGLDIWDQVSLATQAHSVHDTRAVDLAWHSTDTTYETGLGVLSGASHDVVSLRIAQHYDESGSGLPDETWNPVGQDLDMLIELDDGTHQAAVRTGVVGAVPYPLAGNEPYSVFTTVRLPLDAFTAVNPSLNLNTLRRLRLRPLRATGRVSVDDVELDTTLFTAPGRVTMLRAHELDTGFGPRDDHLDVEVVVQLDVRPGESFGFPMRDGEHLPTTRGMLALLRRSLAKREPVQIGYLPAGATARQAFAVRVP